MTIRKHADLGVALACALSLGLAACGGGGGGGNAATGGSGGGGGSTPTPSTPITNPPSNVQPTLFIEHDPDGTAYIRVQEQTYNPFGSAGPARTIQNQNAGPSPGADFIVTGEQSTYVANINATRMKVGMDLMSSGLVSIYNYNFDDVEGNGDIYGAGVKLGANARPTTGATFLQRAFADGRESPDATYTISNTDFIGIERNSKSIYVRDVTGRRFGDAGIDTKAGPVFVMNATLQGGHRMLRLWSGVEVTIANSIVNASPGQMQVWLQDSTSALRYYNVLWCLNAATPSPSDPNCHSKPWLIESDGMTAAQAIGRTAELTSNPLPSVSTFFATQIDQIIVEYSSNGGTSWQALGLLNTGSPGHPPNGDLRFKIPLDLNAGDYRFAAYYMRNGAAIGHQSRIINEAGAAL
ncbi:MAG: hypothetical protein ABUS48_06965 [Pseudomonadota bacterium]